MFKYFLFFLLCSAVIIHLTPPQSVVKKKKETTFFFFLSKPKSKKRLHGGSQPSELSSCEIGAQPAWSQRLRQKIPFQGDRNNQNTSCLSCHAVPAPLPSAHYSPPPPLSHLSELFQVDASNLS